MKMMVKLMAAATLAALLASCGSEESKTSIGQQNISASGIEKDNFDTAVKHSDNFYYSVNGNWFKNTEIPFDKPRYDVFSKLDDESQIAVRDIIQSVASKKGASPGTDEQKLGDFYNSYMNEAAIESLGVQPIQADLAKIGSIRDFEELAAAFGAFQWIGVDLPVAWYVDSDAKTSSSYAVYLSQSGLGLPDRDYYLLDSDKFKALRAAYTAYLGDILALAGIADAQNAATRILALETRLAEKQWSAVDNRDQDKTYNKFAKAELRSALGGFPWDVYAKAVKLDTVNELIVRQPSYLAALGTIYRDTDLQTWKEYLAARFVSEYAGKLSKAFVDRRFEFYDKILYGIPEQQPRWKKAVDASNDVLGEVVGRLYVARYFKPEAKARMQTLVKNLIKAFHASIDELEWMTPETKKAAHDKLNTFKPKIGYPDTWKDYSSLEIRADDLVGNYKSYAVFTYSRMLDKLGKPVDRSEWFMTPQTVNAYYNPMNNEVVFPAAILQPPFFTMDADDAVNYGGIGAVIGHEVSHGFDDQGAKYDGNGNLRNWWTDADRAEFEKRGEKLVAQYNQYSPIEGMHVNGRLTLGESIGDLSGLTVALRAYMLSLKGNEAPFIDGFTGVQRFFINWSQVWKCKYREEYLRTMLLKDPHPPAEYRVIGVVSNIPEFYAAFDVKQGDGMYIAPEKRVKIW